MCGLLSQAPITCMFLTEIVSMLLEVRFFGKYLLRVGNCQWHFTIPFPPPPPPDRKAVLNVETVRRWSLEACVCMFTFCQIPLNLNSTRFVIFIFRLERNGVATISNEMKNCSATCYCLWFSQYCRKLNSDMWDTTIAVLHVVCFPHLIGKLWYVETNTDALQILYVHLANA